MTVYTAPFKVQILVGPPGAEIDFSDNYGSFRVGYPAIDTSGLLRISASLTLTPTRIPPVTFDTRTQAGKQFWKVNQIVLINLETSPGVYERHPCGFLWINTAPLPPSPVDLNPVFELDLVCVLQLRTYPAPRGKGLQFTPQYPPAPTAPIAPTNQFERDDAIAQGLQELGVAAAYVGSIPKHPMQSSIRKTRGGPGMDLLGQVAWGGCCALYQDNQGQVNSFSLSLAARTPLCTIEIGKDEVGSYSYVANDSRIEKITYAANQQIIFTAFPRGLGTTQIDKGDGAIVDPNLLGVEITIRQTTRNESVSGTSKTHTETVLAPLGMINPAAFPRQTGMGLDSEKIESWFFDGPNKALSLHVVSETGLFSKICASVWGKLSAANQAALKNEEVTIVEETRYSYVKEQVSEIVYQRVEPLGAIVTDEKLEQTSGGVTSLIVNPLTPTLSAFRRSSWTKTREGEWMAQQYSLGSATRLGLQLVRKDASGNPIQMTLSQRIAVKSALTTDGQGTFTIVSNTGAANPPSTERQSVEQELRSVPLEGASTFIFENPEFEPREETRSLEVGVSSSAQLTELGQLEGGWAAARAQGAQIQIPFRQEFVDNPEPMQMLAVIETEERHDGKKKNLILYQIDAIEYIHDEEEMQIAADLLWIGTIEGTLVPHDQTPIAPTFSASAVKPPYSEIRIDTAGTGSDGELLIPPPPKMTSTSYAGLGFGATTEHRTLTSSVHVSSAGMGIGAKSNLPDILASTAGLGFGATTDHVVLVPPSPDPYTITQNGNYGDDPQLQGTYAKLTDNDGSTGAGTLYGYNFNGTNAYIKATFPAPVTVTNVRVGGGTLPTYSNVAFGLNQLELQYSTDDSVWTTVATIDGVTDSGPSQFLDIPIASITAQYWRLWHPVNGTAATTEFQITYS